MLQNQYIPYCMVVFCEVWVLVTDKCYTADYFYMSCGNEFVRVETHLCRMLGRRVVQSKVDF